MILASILHSGQVSRLGGKGAGKLPGKYKVQTRISGLYFARNLSGSPTGTQEGLHSPAAAKTFTLSINSDIGSKQ